MHAERERSHINIEEISIIIKSSRELSVYS